MSEDSKNRGVQAPEGAREWLSQMQQLSEQIQQQQQNAQQMMQELMNTYMQHLNTPGSYASGQAEQQQQAQQQQQSLQQMFQESLNTFMQMFNIPHSYLQEGMRRAQEDMPGTAQQEVSDDTRKTKRRSSRQSSS